MFIFPSGTQSGYQITRSLRLRKSATAYLSRTPSTAGNRNTWTWSGWVKRGQSGSSNLLTTSTAGISSAMYLYFTNDNLYYWDRRTAADGDVFITTQVFRDYSSWYHIVLSVDRTQATAANRVKLYVNGTQVTAFSTINYPNQNENSYLNATTAHYISTTDSLFDGYIADVNFIDGQALAPTSFGEFDSVTGVWKPKKYTGTYGTNGYYLNFKDNSAVTAAAIGKDSSGNGNNWTPNGISLTAGVTYDSMIDSPTMGVSGTQPVGNYPVINTLQAFSTGNATISNGNLTMADSSTATRKQLASMALPSSGKWYWETTITALANSLDFWIGVVPDSTIQSGFTSIVGGYRSTGVIWNLAGTAQTSGATYTTNDIVGVAVDVDSGTVQFYKNNVAQGASPSFTFTAGTILTPYLWMDNNAGSRILNWNFGQRPFNYTPPTGFKALCTSNLPDSTITAGNKYMDVKTYTTTTNGNFTVTFPALNYSANGGLVWEKKRDGATNPAHYLTDSVRGVSKNLNTETTNAEGTDANYITGFTSTGYTEGSNGWFSGQSIVSWGWVAGGSAVTNTAGSITSQVSANPASGFSIVTYTGIAAAGTVGHGLGVAPKMIIVKTRNTTSSWPVYSSILGAANKLYLNTTAASASSSNWNSTSPTSTVFSLGGSVETNTSGNTYVAYCFAEVPGFSKFGSYTGNASTDGPFVYLGFRPKFVMTKQTNTISDWNMFDAGRNLFNATNNILAADLSNAEFSNDTNNPVDLLSNGFKLRGSNAGTNASGGSYIYMAFAENPFKNSLAR